MTQLMLSFLQKSSLADMETALVRNLTDHMGNNLLHIVCRQVGWMMTWGTRCIHYQEVFEVNLVGVAFMPR